MSRVPDSENVVPSKLEVVHDSALQTKTGAQAHQMEPSISLAGRQVIAGRYAILGQLGRGGMGEVWHAFDLKLRVDVALKSLRTDRVQQDVELLRREVRTAREVISPNVCRIFDLVVEEGQELVSMEYIDGVTLAELLQKGSLEPQQAAEIASQFLAGLEAIHRAGLVHRDFKPENVMLTRTGRVVVMDFGIAKPVAQFSETISGTPSYMAPEQLEGRRLDPRSDIFAAGVVLAEMIQPEGVKSKESREALLRAIRQEPLHLPEHPWSKLIARAVAKNFEDRFGSALSMMQSLQEVAQRSESDELKRPYPGLSAFTEEDAEFFFGRELEVEAVIKKLQQLHLMAIIGPSGAGKTSFLHAGLIPALPEEWGCIVCQPGDSPNVNLAHALVEEFAGDKDATYKMIRFEEIDVALSLLRQCRYKHKEGLLIVDRFEELFTLNPEETQSKFAELLGRAALEADVRILLTMRDDFLLQCHRFSALAAIFDGLIPMLTLSGAELRRAIAQPAIKCGYRFEDGALVEEIFTDIEKERGALPLMAFAAEKIWEKRDKQTGLLTRSAYQEIGGVAGALAQHAESTMARIGADKHEIVREIFRNLITAQGTRVARDLEQLLSVFKNRKDAMEVVRALIDARLLTSFEVKDEGKSRVEIIHESLLTAWPRLVRWKTQDADSAQLRDQLRQAAHLWEERGKPADLLWTGSSYREFIVWQERYTGGLSAVEETFANAMIRRTNRKRRQRNIVVSAMFIVLLLIMAIIINFWHGEKAAREQAVGETRKAEASKILTLARNEMEQDPTVALAYAMTSLETSDNPAARRFALEALSKAPPLSIMADMPVRPTFMEFSPDGRWLAVGGFGGVRLLRKDGKALILEEGFGKTLRQAAPQFAPDGDRVVWISAHDPSLLRVWSIAQNKEIQRLWLEGRGSLFLVRGRRVFIFSANLNVQTGKKGFLVQSWNFDDPQPRTLGQWDVDTIAIRGQGRWSADIAHFGANIPVDIDPTARWIGYRQGKSIYLRSIENFASASDVFLGEDPSEGGIIFLPNGKEVATRNVSSGETRIWSIDPLSKTPLRVIQGRGPTGGLFFNHSGSILASYSDKDESICLWKLKGKDVEAPLFLRRKVKPFFPFVAFDPTDQWAAAPYGDSIAFWPLSRIFPRLLHGNGTVGAPIDFTPDGKHLAASFETLSLFSWPNGPNRALWKPSRGEAWAVTADPLSRFLGVDTSHTGLLLISIPDGKATLLPGTSGEFGSIVFSPDGKLAASSAPTYNKDWSGISIWNLVSGESTRLVASNGIYSLVFSPEGRLFSGDERGDLRQWNLKDGTSEVVIRAPVHGELTYISFVGKAPNLMMCLWLSAKQGDLQTYRSELRILDLKTRTSRPIVSHGNRISMFAVDSSGKLLVTGTVDGVVQVGSVTGDEPHLLFGHDYVFWVAIHPDGQWIASSERFRPEVRFWPIPKGRPFQTLPYDEFLNRLRALTNVRVVQDNNSSTGYRNTLSAFHGWEKVPEW